MNLAELVGYVCQNQIKEGLKMTKLINLTKKFISDEEGATAVEYGVLIALIIAACVAIIAILGGQIQQGFQAVSDELTGAGLTGS